MLKIKPIVWKDINARYLQTFHGRIGKVHVATISWDGCRSKTQTDDLVWIVVLLLPGLKKQDKGFSSVEAAQQFVQKAVDVWFKEVEDDTVSVGN